VEREYQLRSKEVEGKKEMRVIVRERERERKKESIILGVKKKK
jgi:hypothetical protein